MKGDRIVRVRAAIAEHRRQETILADLGVTRKCLQNWARSMGHADVTAYFNQRVDAAANTVEDVEWMLKAREWPPRICERLDVEPASLARRLFRSGRPDLAAHFATLEKVAA